MATITTLQNTDSGSTSLGVINTNFSNLNTDKIEAADSKTLTNKSISADTNTITNLTPTNIKAANKTGADTFIVTGTKGSTSELAMWNVDGDVVTAGVSTTTSQPSSSSTNTTIPTSKAVYDYVTARVGTAKEMFIRHTATGGTVTNVNNYPVVSLNTGQDAYFSIQVPSDFSSLTSIEFVMIPDTTESITYTLTANYAASSELNSTVSSTDTGTTDNVTINVMQYVPVQTKTNFAVILAALAANDMLGIKYASSTTLVRIVGIRFKYVAA